MINFAKIRATLETFFNGNKPTGFPTIVWDTQTFEPTPGTPWVRFEIVEDSDERITLTGTPLVGQETTGIVVISYYQPQGLGWQTPDTMLHAAGQLFNEARIPITDSCDYIEFDTVDRNEQMVDDPWIQKQISFNFRIYENQEATP